MVVGQDADFSTITFENRYKADLGNNLGNLVNRLLNMVGRNYAGAMPPRPPTKSSSRPCVASRITA
jgi:methionyl-tRNA synthetase